MRSLAVAGSASCILQLSYMHERYVYTSPPDSTPHVSIAQLVQMDIHACALIIASALQYRQCARASCGQWPELNGATRVHAPRKASNGEAFAIVPRLLSLRLLCSYRITGALTFSNFEQTLMLLCCLRLGACGTCGAGSRCLAGSRIASHYETIAPLSVHPSYE